MPSTFTTYYGSSFHGVFVEWTHDPAAAAKTLLANITVNFYAEIQEIGADAAFKIDVSAAGPYPDAFNFGVIFEILDTSDCAAVVCRDGMAAILDATITDYNAVAPLFVTPTFGWNVSEADTNRKKDLLPTAIDKYDEANTFTAHTVYVTPGATDLCLEVWKLVAPNVACVKY